MKVKLPFEPSTLGNSAGIGALGDREFLHRSLESNARGMRLLTGGLASYNLRAIPSEANFLMVPMPSSETAQSLTQSLVERGVIIRALSNFGLPSCIRISIGTESENDFLLQTLKKIF